MRRPGRRQFLRATGAVAAVGAGTLLAPRPAWAADVSLSTSLSSSKTSAGQGVYLTVEVKEVQSGRGTSVSRPMISIDDGQGKDPGTVRYQLTKTGSRSSFSFGTGVNRSEVISTYTYVVMPDAPGKFIIKASVDVGGKSVIDKSAPILEVEAGALPPPTVDPDTGSPSTGSGGAAERPNVKGRPKVFLRHYVDSETAYVNEPLVYTYEIWQRVDARIDTVALPSFKDFYVDELPTPGLATRTTADGTRYRVHTLLRRVIYPQRSGKVQVGPGEVNVSPQVAFGLFSRPSAQPPFAVKGQPLEIEVDALPAEGQPAGFSPNSVGRFRVESSVDRAVVEVGDALTWKVVLAGEGNVRAIDPGAWPDIDGLRRYDPKDAFEPTQAANRVGGRRTWETLLVAERPGKLQIPAYRFPYFDPDTGKYAVAKAPAIEIEVRGSAADAEADTDGASTTVDSSEPTSADDDLLAEPFTPETLPRRAPPRPGMSAQMWRRLTLAAPAVLGLGWGATAAMRRWGPDDATRERARRASWAKSRIDEARRTVAAGEGFHGAIADLLHAAAVRRAGSSGVGLPRERLAALLSEQGVSAAEISAWRKMLDDCDAARFGAAVGDEASRRALLDRTLQLIESKPWRVA